MKEIIAAISALAVIGGFVYSYAQDSEKKEGKIQKAIETSETALESTKEAKEDIDALKAVMIKQQAISEQQSLYNERLLKILEKK